MNYNQNMSERLIAKQIDKLIASNNRAIHSEKVVTIEGQSNFMEEINEYLKNGGRITKYAARYAEGYNSRFANLHTSALTGEDDSEQSSYYAGISLYLRSGPDSDQT